MILLSVLFGAASLAPFLIGGMRRGYDPSWWDIALTSLGLAATLFIARHSLGGL